MAEAFAALGVVSSIITLVEFTSKVVKRLNEVYSDTIDIPKSLSHLKAELPLVLHTLQKIQEAIQAKRLSDGCVAALLPVVKGCDQSIHDINSILEKTLPTQDDGRTRKVYKSMGSVLNDGKIEGIMTTLRGYMGTLTFHFTASISMLQPLTDEKLVKLRQWLSAPDPSVNFDKALRLRQANTGLWLIDSDLYKRWKANASMVWLHGIPGCGKTVLSSTVLEDISNHTRDDPDKALAYFYFDFNDRQKQDPEMMIRSLVAQLSKQCIKIPQSFDDLSSSCDNGQRQISRAPLLNILRNLVEDLPHVYFIIDALDECENRGELMDIIRTIAAWQLQGLHILFTSRREGDIKLTLESILENQNIICIQTKAIDHDIQLYVRQQLSNNESFRKWRADDTIRQRIEDSLGEKARGMFRLAACQLDILKRCRNRKQLERDLESLPSDLDETYNRILAAIKGDDISYAIRILRWLAFSETPLSLAQVAEIAALEADRCPAFDRDEVLEDPEDVLTICSSLVTITSSDEADNASYNTHMRPSTGSVACSTLMLAHYSVKEYLVSKRILESKMGMFGLEAPLCHRTIAKCCLQYLLQFDEGDPLTEDTLNQFALAEYSAQRWMEHTKSSSESDGDLIHLVVELLKEKGQAFLTWIRLYDPDRPWKRVDFERPSTLIPAPLYYASKLDMRDVVQFMIEKGADVNAQSNGSYDNALQVASRYGYLDVAQLLIQEGADVNAQVGYYNSALQVASTHGSLEVVQLLIEKGADVNAQGGHFGSALQAASYSGNPEVVKLLIEKEADINAKGGYYGSALQAASYPGSLEVVQLLIEKGADVNAQGGHFGSALQAASCSGSLEVVQLLIEKGADVNAQGGHFGSVLQAASRRGNLEVVQLLIEKETDINAKGGYYGSALQAASYSGSLEVVRLSIEKGADINTQGGENGSALQAASRRGNLEVVRLLIEKGADVNTQGGKYNNALQAAIDWGRSDTVKLLIEKGADVERR